MRGAKVTLHQHFDGTQELRWRQRNLKFTVLTRALRQAQVADGKTVNRLVDEALVQRGKTNTKGHKPAPNHPWRNMPLGKPATGGLNATP